MQRAAVKTASSALVTLLSAVLAFVLTLVLYLATRTNVHTFDALSYVLDVDRKPWQELFHPHHVAYGPFGALMHVLARFFGYTGSAMIVLQGANMVAGACGVALFHVVVFTVTRRRDLAWCAALLLAGSYAYWYYAVEVEVYTIAALFLIGALWLLVHLLAAPRYTLWFALGLMQGLAVLFHQTNVLLCAPVAVVLLLVYRANVRRLVGATLAYALPLAVIVAGSYLVIGFGVSGFRSWAAFVAWAEGYAQTGWWGGALGGSKVGELGQGLAETIAQPGGTVAGLVLVGLAVAYGRRVAARQVPLVLCLVAWLAVYGGFFFWWEPDNIEFWIASLPPALLLLCIALSQRTTRWHPGVLVVCGVGVAMLALNYAAITQRGDAANDLQRQVARALADHSTPGDLLLVPDGLQELYLPYYEDRTNVLSINQTMADTEGNWDAGCNAVRGRIDATLASGNGVLVGAAVLQPTRAAAGEPPTPLERFGLTAEQIAQCFQPYAAGFRPLSLAASLPAYYELPPAQVLADGPGWDFTRGQWGWQAQNATTTTNEGEWTIVPATDPRIVGPLMQIDTAQYRAIEVRLAATTANRDAQLFFYNDQRQINEARSVRWRLQDDTALHTYRLDLRSVVGWTGVVTGLRLDPVAAGDGGTVTIMHVRLLR